MSTTITATVPVDLKQALRSQVIEGKFSSLSEAVRTAVQWLVENKTVNGFTKEFEEGVLKAAEEPTEGIWDNSKGDFVDYVLKR